MTATGADLEASVFLDADSVQWDQVDFKAWNGGAHRPPVAAPPFCSWQQTGGIEYEDPWLAVLWRHEESRGPFRSWYWVGHRPWQPAGDGMQWKITGIRLVFPWAGILWTKVFLQTPVPASPTELQSSQDGDGGFETIVSMQDSQTPETVPWFVEPPTSRRRTL